ncbi:unnamed protein product [Chrysodeixis includens]|uniref:Regulatory protein zeste n=1 Tax=Chrysodeixis includens TaxID=689277 RepID=A0A9N8PZR7_CHRIL|nr:unnamed protein product [Chrysodeixis includens]
MALIEMLCFKMRCNLYSRNGDLSKGGRQSRKSRNYAQIKWKELSNKLNSEGESGSEEKWREVWSDYKYNCMLKCARIHKSSRGTGGWPAALQLSMTDLENRVMQIVGLQAAIGMPVNEHGFAQDEATEITHSAETTVPEECMGDNEIDWNTPGTSNQPTVAPPPPTTAANEALQSSTEAHSLSPRVDDPWQPPPQKKTKKENNIHHLPALIPFHLGSAHHVF